MLILITECSDNNETHPSTKDESIWFQSARVSGRTPAHNTIRGSLNKVMLPPGVTIETPVQSLKLIFSEDLITLITKKRYEIS